jgi:hypothetical protein
MLRRFWAAVRRSSAAQKEHNNNLYFLIQHRNPNMIYRVVVAVILAAAVCSAKVFTEDVAQQKELWAKFKSDHNVKYETTEEESRRFEIFLTNLKHADELTEKDHQNGGTATFGVTRFFRLDPGRVPFSVPDRRHHQDQRGNFSVASRCG